MTGDPQLEIHGTPPRLAQLRCDELLCEQYWRGGKLEETANVIYQTERPQGYVIADLNAEARLDDLGARVGLAGRTLDHYTTLAVPGGCEVAFHFDSGQSVVFRNVDDRTSFDLSPAN